MQKAHFLRLAYSFSLHNTLSTLCKWSRCLVKFLLEIRMSSKYTTTNLLMNARNTWFIKHINILSGFVSPNSITNHSYKPCFILNVVFHSSPSFILIWWYPLFKSILEKIQDPCNSSNMSLSLGMGCLYFTVKLLTTHLSTHILHVPSFLGKSSMGTSHGLILSRMYPFSISSSTCIWSSFVSSWSHGHTTHNQDWDLILESQNRFDRSVTQWKPAPRHQHY